MCVGGGGNNPGIIIENSSSVYIYSECTEMIKKITIKTFIWHFESYPAEAREKFCRLRLGILSYNIRQ